MIQIDLYTINHQIHLTLVKYTDKYAVLNTLYPLTHRLWRWETRRLPVVSPFTIRSYATHTPHTTHPIPH